MVRIYEVMAGEHIQMTAKAMVAMANNEKQEVHATFNGVQLIAKPGNFCPDTIVAAFEKEMDRLREEYERSPKGKAAAAALAENQRIIAEAQAKGPVPFSIRDQAAWKKWSDANRDGYGAGVLRYAALWANIMEKKMAKGATLADIADKASHEADVEGITGFMYGAAVQVLAETWSEGEALRCWHNLKTQLHDEGAKANATGGVLNPALLHIGDKEQP